MSKEIILTAEEIPEQLNADKNVLELYQWALQNAGVAMTSEEIANFVTQRNAKSGWRELWEVKARLQTVVDSIETVVKHTMNVDSSAPMPEGFGWKSSGTNKSFADGACSAVAEALIKKHLVTKEQLFEQLDPSKVAKACGMKVEKLMDMFPDTIKETQKAPSLSVK